jgi:hypothetical protein
MTEASAKNGKNGAFAAGAAAGVVGGVLLGGALSGANAAPAQPVYVGPAPADPVYVNQPRYVERPRYADRRWAEIDELRADCYAGSRRSCIRFGMALERNRASRAKWARARPDFYSWERE